MRKSEGADGKRISVDDPASAINRIGRTLAAAPLFFEAGGQGL
jgi:hypothetical protein